MQFRKENTVPIFSVIDEIFGLKRLYKRTHHLYESCLYIFQDRFNSRIEINEDGSPALEHVVIPNIDRAVKACDRKDGP